MAETGQTNWIDASCFFALGVAEADLKSLLPPGVTMTNGFVCSNQDEFPPEQLASIFTGILGLLQKQIDGAPSSTAFFECLLRAQMCDWFNGRFWCDVISGNNGNGSITLPTTGGPWKPFGIMWGGSDNDSLIDSGGFFGLEKDDEDDLYLAFVAPDVPVAGGTTYTPSSINGDVSDNLDNFVFAMFAVDMGCP